MGTIRASVGKEIHDPQLQDAIKRERLRRKLQQQTLADRLGVPRWTVGVAERHGLFNPRYLETFRQFAAGESPKAPTANIGTPNPTPLKTAVTITGPIPSTQHALTAQRSDDLDAAGIVRLLARAVNNDDVRLVLKLADRSGHSLQSLARA